MAFDEEALDSALVEEENLPIRVLEQALTGRLPDGSAGTRQN